MMRIASLAVSLSTVLGPMASPLYAQTFDVSLPPGANYDVADFRLAGLFAINRRAGALWALAVEPGVSHAVAGSKDMAALFFDEVIPLRLPEASSRTDGTPVLRPLDRDSGFIADPKSGRSHTAADAPRTTYPTSGLASETLADAWRRLVGLEN